VQIHTFSHPELRFSEAGIVDFSRINSSYFKMGRWKSICVVGILCIYGGKIAGRRLGTVEVAVTESRDVEVFTVHEYLPCCYLLH
jgi:hypothetical protein